MSTKKILISIFSNWSNMLLNIIIAFIVSPILVNQLGDEIYGIWVLIVSLVSYFTVLDFGVNAAIVRFVSKYTALKKDDKVNAIYSTSFAFFSLISLLVIIVTLIFSYFFTDFFSITAFSREYLYLVFACVGFSLALNLTFSVFLGTLQGLQHFFEINVIEITINIIKNIILVTLLFNDYSLLAIAILQLAAAFIRIFLQFLFLKKNHSHLKFTRTQITKQTMLKLFNYSIYIFIIAVASKILLYTDSVIIGALIEVSQVTFYAIPAMIAQYLEQMIWAVIAVFIPIISAQEATGNIKRNRDLYLFGTKYSLLICSPVILVLLIVGKDFIGLWMGTAFSEPSGDVLNILLIGYIFLLSQLIADGILQGLGKHKILAIILVIEAVVNLVLSLYLAPIYGISGVAAGTVIPMLIANIIVIPFFTCKILELNYFQYLAKAVIPPTLSLIIFYLGLNLFNVHIINYFQLILFSALVAFTYLIYAFFIHVESQHKKQIINKLKYYLTKLMVVL